MKITNKLKSFVVLMITALAFTSCVKQDFDPVETANVDPDLTSTMTIHQLQALATGPVGVEITQDIIIDGVIVADDSSGNIYKKMIIQQDSSGLAINVDKSSYYTTYKVGRHIYVKCKGLFISNNGGNFELGNSATDPVGRIPWALVGQYIFPGKWGQYIKPKVYHFSDNIPAYTLVQFNNIEFATPGVVWATATSFNLDIDECGINPGSLIVYSSQYATFHLLPVPSGNGTIVGIYSLYNGAGELQVRDERDAASMTNLRCNGGTGNLVNMQLDSIRLLDPGAGNLIQLPADKMITVTVTSDYTTNMLTSKNVYVQDATAAIQIRFTGTHSFAKGTILKIDVSSQELSTYTGVLQINNVPLQNAVPIGVSPVTPLTTTINNIDLNYNTLEGQLVKLDNVTISGATGTYLGASGVNTITDGTLSTIELYTSSFATFVSDSFPVTNVSVTGILTEFNGTKEILIRNINDVQ